VTIRLYIDRETGEPHISEHNVTEQEVADLLAKPMEDRAGHDGSRVALGQTRGGRYLKVIYVRDTEPDSVFVITAYDLSNKEKQALRRRRRRFQ
jgi:hypothetical protein